MVVSEGGVLLKDPKKEQVSERNSSPFSFFPTDHVQAGGGFDLSLSPLRATVRWERSVMAVLHVSSD